MSKSVEAIIPMLCQDCQTRFPPGTKFEVDKLPNPTRIKCPRCGLWSTLPRILEKEKMGPYEDYLSELANTNGGGI